MSYSKIGIRCRIDGWKARIKQKRICKAVSSKIYIIDSSNCICEDTIRQNYRYCNISEALTFFAWRILATCWHMYDSFLRKSRNSKGDFQNILCACKQAYMHRGRSPMHFSQNWNSFEKYALKIPGIWIFFGFWFCRKHLSCSEKCLAACLGLQFLLWRQCK